MPQSIWLLWAVRSSLFPSFPGKRESRQVAQNPFILICGCYVVKRLFTPSYYYGGRTLPRKSDEKASHFMQMVAISALTQVLELPKRINVAATVCSFASGYWLQSRLGYAAAQFSERDRKEACYLCGDID